MKYSDIRSKIVSGDLIAFEHHNPASRLVQVTTRSAYSHIAIAWVVSDRVYVFEAVQPLVRIYPLSKLAPFYWCNIGKDLNQKALNFLNSNVGARYSLVDCINAFLGETTDDDKWQCAELCRQAKRLNGHDIDCKATPGAMMDWGSAFNPPVLVG